MSRISSVLRLYINRKNRIMLHNKNFSLISSNCNGAFILHDLNQKFLSPTVNLWFKPADYIKFLKNLETYIEAELKFSDVEERKVGYPVGILNNEVYIYFQHYKTRESAKEKWDDRCKRLNMENLFILFTDRDGCTYDNLRDFDNLPYKNKIVFTKKEYPEFNSSFYIKGFENENSVGICSTYKGPFSGYRYYDDFPYVKWFNGEI